MTDQISRHGRKSTGRRKGDGLAPAADSIVVAELAAKLESARVRIDKLLSNVPGVVWEAWSEPDSSTQRIDFVSDYVETMLGYTVEEWTSTPNFWLTIVHPDDKDKAAAAASATFEAGHGINEFRWVAKDGRVIWVESQSTAIRDEAGNAVGMRGMTMDITERRRHEAKLRETEEAERAARALAEASVNRQAFLSEASSILSSSLDYEVTMASLANLCVPFLADWCVVDVLDSSGLRRVAVVHADSAKMEFASQLRERYQPDANSPEVRQVLSGQSLYLPEISEDLMQRSARDAEHLEIMRNLGLHSVLAVALKAAGHTVGILTLVTAESGRTYTEVDAAVAEDLGLRAGLAVENAMLYRASQEVQEELRRANEAKDEFLGLVSHELRTPITTIYGGARLLRTRGLSIDEASQVSVLEDIEHESERLHRIVEDLLVLARVELGEQIETEPVLIQRTVEKSVSSFNKRRPGRAFVVQLDDEMEPVRASNGYLEQILRNLLNNADKYSPPDTTIEVVSDMRDGQAVISVMDRGPGIPPEEADLIFERFYRSHRTAKQAGGAGIGLTVCKRLVEAQDGHIWAEPREGGGLIVSFSLPRYEDRLQ